MMESASEPKSANAAVPSCIGGSAPLRSCSKASGARHPTTSGPSAMCAAEIVAERADEPDALEDGGGTGTSPGGSDPGAGGGPVATPSGLPCDVADVLAALCTSCHSDPPRSSAPEPLVTREQLLAPSAVDPSMSYAERSVIRMRAGTMPASGGAEADADVIEAWLAAGAPAGACPLEAPPNTFEMARNLF